MRRWMRWAARTFRVRAPRKHLLPSTGAALLALTLDNWVQVCYDPKLPYKVCLGHKWKDKSARHLAPLIKFFESFWLVLNT